MLRLQRLRPLAIAFALISAPILTGCATLTTAFGALTTKRAEAVDVNAVACGAFKPITWARADTDQTILQVREHNAAYVELCGGAPQ